MKYLYCLALALTFSACGKVDGKKPESTQPTVTSVNPLGLFQSTACFKNKFASQGLGQDVWTKATMDFRADGSATNGFELFTDQDCAVPAMQGSGEIEYVFLKKIGSVTVIQVDQLNDPNDPNSVFRFWILGILSQEGYVMDIEFSSGDSGPYDNEPGETEVAAFLANLNARGVLFQRQ